MADASHQATAEMMEEQRKKMEKALYFYRTGDMTVWNYVILSLAFVGLLLGLFFLTKNILNNKKRKMIALYQMRMAAQQPEESDGKQAVVTLEKEDASQEASPVQKQPQPGDITVQWRDGQISALYTEVPEADV
ncbi:organic solute transporter subunit beta [Hyperolius riggenbachi]|uniref:organic solute transporter subunit beta n=1 Tax=Hyperolius riggenbachi TaxID=752182 RepID=UPI0035A2BA56